MSDPERRLWSHLRMRQLGGYKFRRQHPIGPYIADFVCLERRLVVEVDGGQHAEPEQMRHDARRTQWLQNEGYHVVRAWTSELSENLDGVLELILHELEHRHGAHRPPPPPAAPRTS